MGGGGAQQQQEQGKGVLHFLVAAADVRERHHRFLESLSPSTPLLERLALIFDWTATSLSSPRNRPDRSSKAGPLQWLVTC